MSAKGQTKGATSNAKTNAANELRVDGKPDRTKEQQIADPALDPFIGAASTHAIFLKGSFGPIDLTESFAGMSKIASKFEKGDHSEQRAMLIGQAIALNGIFTEFARRSAANMGEYVNAAERYMRLALKAQAQSRATIEALEGLARGGEQIIKHVHVDNRGGQAVIADSVQTGGKNAQIDEQPHASEMLGVSESEGLWSENAERESVPVTCDG
ncbi:MAG: hypothetical protein IPF48_08470 [Sphingomonadales bacterium]|nr:hypothetical protein [Sphingomonadales bacterium]